MTKQFITKALSAAVPAILGFLGGFAAMFWPVYHSAFCAGLL